MRRTIALVVVLLLIGGGAAVPAPADAAPAKTKACLKKAKTKKAKKKCKKAPARPAAPGPAGAQGPAGPAGPPGTSIVARARMAAPMTISGVNQAPVPLQGGAWTQQADESDDFIGEVTMTLPAECTASGPGPTDNPTWWVEDQIGGFEYVGGAWVDLKLGKDYIGWADFPVFEGGKTVTESFSIQRKLMEPGTATPRELTAEVGSYCENADSTFTVQAVKVNVVGIR